MKVIIYRRNAQGISIEDVKETRDNALFYTIIKNNGDKIAVRFDDIIQIQELKEEKNATSKNS